jgi:SAM-dependent methyltransferase
MALVGTAFYTAAMRNWLAVLWISLWLPLHTAALWLQDARFYRQFRLLRVDWGLALAYWWRDRYFLARREGRRLDVPPETLTYGTTPWATAADLLRRVDAKPGERFLELGCGEGRLAFFVRIWGDLTVDAFDLLPTFIRVAERIRQRLRLERISFHQANLLEADLATADIVYLAGTCLDDETIDRLQERMRWLKPGARLICLSYPLDVPGLELIAEVPIAVSWGHSTAYLQRMTPSS